MPTFLNPRHLPSTLDILPSTLDIIPSTLDSRQKPTLPSSKLISSESALKPTCYKRNLPISVSLLRVQNFGPELKKRTAACVYQLLIYHKLKDLLQESKYLRFLTEFRL